MYDNVLFFCFNQLQTEMFWMDLFVLVWNYRQWVEARRIDSILAKFK
jgi:hypothetical protein